MADNQQQWLSSLERVKSSMKVGDIKDLGRDLYAYRNQDGTYHVGKYGDNYKDSTRQTRQYSTPQQAPRQYSLPNEAPKSRQYSLPTDAPQYSRQNQAPQQPITQQPIVPQQPADTGTPEIYRGDDGSINVKSDLTKYKDNVSFIQEIKDMIKKQQGMNKDIQSGREYWRSLSSNTSPFGGTIDPALQREGMFTDEQFRLLSPSQQASVRASRIGAANANLRGLSEEEKFRETSLSDTISNIKDMMAEQDKLDKAELDKAERMLDIAMKKQNLGLEPTAEDLGLDSSKGIGTKIGGSVSWRHNNPLNLKYSAWQDKYGATKGQSGTDGGSFAVFPNIESAIQASKDLLKGKLYGNKTLESAMRLWSNNGYGAADIIGLMGKTGQSYMPGREISYSYLASKPMKDFTDSEFNSLFSAMQQREGWKEGTMLASSSIPSEITKSDIKNIKSIYGLTDEETKKFTPDEWNTLYTNKDLYKESKQIDEASKFVSQNLQKDGNTVYRDLRNKYPQLSESNQKLAMENGGFMYDSESKMYVKETGRVVDLGNGRYSYINNDGTVHIGTYGDNYQDKTTI